MTLHHRGRTLVLLAGAALVVTVGEAGCGSGSGNSPGGSGGAAATGTGGSGGASGSGGGNASGGASGSGGAVDAAVDQMMRMVPTMSGVDRTKTLSSLSLDEQKKLCDFRAAKFDGYGKSIDCGNGTMIGSEDDQAQCLGPDYLGGYCPTATVAQVEACTNDTTCDNPQPDSCEPLNACP